MKKLYRLFAITLILALVLVGCRPIENDEDNETTTEAETVKIVYPEGDGKTVICLDAGHGFRDIGCDTDLLSGTEAEVTLSVVMMLKAELEKKGAKVILTHDGETFPQAETIKSLADKAGVEYGENDIIENDIFSATERAIYTASIAEDEGIDLFVSLHVNSIEGQPDISRYEIDYFAENPYSSALRVFSESLSERLDNETIIYEDSFEEAFRVTKTGTHPAVLIEMGYATNKADAEKLNSIVWRESFAKNLADCIIEWVSSYEEK